MDRRPSRQCSWDAKGWFWEFSATWTNSWMPKLGSTGLETRTTTPVLLVHSETHLKVFWGSCHSLKHTGIGFIYASTPILSQTKEVMSHLNVDIKNIKYIYFLNRKRSIRIPVFEGSNASWSSWYSGPRIRCYLNSQSHMFGTTLYSAQ